MKPLNRPPHLLHFRLSHFNEKVRWALDYKRWPHTRRALVPGFHIPVARWHSGQNQLPILIIEGDTIAGSSHILAEIERLRPDPPLFPADSAEYKKAQAICAFFDEEVAPDLRRLFWGAYLDQPDDCARMATNGFSDTTRKLWHAAFPLMRPVLKRNMGLSKDDLRAARKSLRSYFNRLERKIGPSGYLVGQHFGVADLTAAAIMSAIVRPPQFSYVLPEPCPPALIELRESVSKHPAFHWVLDIYARHRGKSCEISIASP